jgi:BirA family transcriptional regulator, biotin operon repressor / biotin---[acetyl-CoA-carboxylase] ligase
VSAVSEFLDRALFERLREERHVTWGRPLRLFESTSSTNDRALEALDEGMKTGGVFVAREQTQGRGRQGAPWQSPPGENLTFSLVLRLPKVAGLSSYPLVVGMALHDALEARVPVGCPLGIKWPNDLYLNRKKLAGVLVEGRSDAGENNFAIGIGLNVDTTEFGADATRRTSLSAAFFDEGCESELVGVDLRKESILVDILKALEDRTRQMVAKRLGRCLADIRKVDVLLGEHLRTGDIVGTGAGIDDEGALLVADRDGELVRVTSGSIEVFW